MQRGLFLKLFISFYLVLLFVGCTKERASVGSQENPIKLFFVPSVDANLLANKADLVAKFLEKETPYKFKVSVPASYVAVVEAFGTARADIAIMNTFGYIMANEKYGAEALITVLRHGVPTYKGQVIARADSGINSIKDIDGKRVAYVDPASTTGYLLPEKLFKDAGVKPSEKVFAQRHDNVVTMVYQRQVDVGATFYSPPINGKVEDARRLVLTQYPDVDKKVKILTLTEAVPNDPIIFRRELPIKIKEDVVNALLDYVKTKEGKEAFSSMYGVTGLIRSDDTRYDGIREVLKTLGKSALDLAKKK